MLAAAAAALIVALLVGGCTREREGARVIMTSTTTIRCVVAEVAGERAQVASIVPGGMCPGHFDIKPRQMQAIERADLFLYHGWESWLPEVMDATGEKTEAVQVGVEGNWMVPDIHIEAITWVRDLLVTLDPAGERLYKEQALLYSNRLLDETRAVCESLYPGHGTRVICAELQADFLTWAGFDILATYGRSENLTPRVLQDLIETGRKHGVVLVVDNLQSGPGIGNQIAADMGAEHVVLTNFPEHGSYIEAVRKNTRALGDALD